VTSLIRFQMLMMVSMNVEKTICDKFDQTSDVNENHS
jgi:hypothetical protein